MKKLYLCIKNDPSFDRFVYYTECSTSIVYWEDKKIIDDFKYHRHKAMMEAKNQI